MKLILRMRPAGPERKQKFIFPLGGNSSFISNNALSLVYMFLIEIRRVFS